MYSEKSVSMSQVGLYKFRHLLAVFVSSKSPFLDLVYLEIKGCEVHHLEQKGKDPTQKRKKDVNNGRGVAVYSEKCQHLRKNAAQHSPPQSLDLPDQHILLSTIIHNIMPVHKI